MGETIRMWHIFKLSYMSWCNKKINRNLLINHFEMPQQLLWTFPGGVHIFEAITRLCYLSSSILLETSEKSEVFRGSRKIPVVWNRLKGSYTTFPNALQNDMEKHLNPNFLVVETFKKNLGTMGHDKENSFLCLFIFIPFHSSMKNHCSRERNQKNSFSSLIFRKISLDIHYLDDVNLLILLLKFLSKCQHFL